MERRASSLATATNAGKQEFASALEAASIRSRAAWVLQLADSHSNSEKALKGLQNTAKGDDQVRRKEQFKHVKSHEEHLAETFEQKQASSKNKRQEKFNKGRGNVEAPIQEF